MSDSTASVLLVAVEPPADGLGVSYVTTPDRTRTLELLKLLRVDLVVVGTNDPLPLTPFARQLRRVSPGQKWVLVGPGVTERDEVAARCCGAAAVLDSPGDFADIDALATRIGLGRRDALSARVRATSLAR
jgi:hypothetical protein